MPRSPEEVISIARALLYGISYPTSSSGRERPAIPDAALAAALKQITNTLSNLASSRFLIIVPGHTPVYYTMQFDSNRFTDMVLDAFPILGIDTSEGEMQSVIQDKVTLNELLLYLDYMFKQISGAGCHIGNVRSSLAWIVFRNRKTYLKLIKRLNPRLHALEPLSPLTQRDHWASRLYPERLPTTPSLTLETVPGDIYPNSDIALTDTRHDY